LTQKVKDKLCHLNLQEKAPYHKVCSPVPLEEIVDNRDVRVRVIGRVVHIVGIFLEHLIKTIHIEKNYQEVNRGSGDSTNSLGTHLRLQSLSTRDVHDQNTTESVRKGSNFSPLPR